MLIETPIDKTNITSKLTKRLILTIGDKGGTGKSTFTRLLAELHRKATTDTLLVDADGTVGQLIQFLGERDKTDALIPDQSHNNGVEYFSLHGDETDRDNLTSILEVGSNTVLVDLPAASITVLKGIEEDLGFFALVKRFKYEITFVSVITPYRASVRGVRDITNLAPTATHVVVRNLKEGDADDFAFWAGSDAEKNFTGLGPRGIMIDLPKLKPRICAQLDEKNIRFLDAPNWAELTLADRSRAQTWIDNATANLAPARKALGLA